MATGSNTVSVNVKMFSVGELGDCFWLKFVNGAKESNMLIDCGSFRNSDKSKKRLKQIVKYIRQQLNGRPLDVVVGTHQHNDHVSGFVHCEDLFEGMVGETWLSWLDDPRDRLAANIKRDHQNLTDNVRKIARQLSGQLRTPVGITESDTLGLYAAQDGDGPEIPAKGIATLKKLPEKGVTYLRPGQALPMPGMPDEAVKIYVLGPPRNQDLLFDKDPKKSETYDPHLATANINAGRLLAALEHVSDEGIDRSEIQFPFSSYHKKSGPNQHNKDILSLYKRDSWRMIERDWLETASRLALYLDSYTNNSSLVLAIQLVKSGKVLLFAADAQTGNWLSWYDIDWKNIDAAFSTEALLQNTVLYKVGHHGSHNATLVKSLEAMNHPELVAMIPVDETDPNITKEDGWKMPAKNLFQRLKEKTRNRVLRMDQGFAKECDPRKTTYKGGWSDIPKKYWPGIDETNGFVEYTVFG